jgi:hypothetical protein
MQPAGDPGLAEAYGPAAARADPQPHALPE